MLLLIETLCQVKFKKFINSLSFSSFSNYYYTMDDKLNEVLPFFNDLRVSDQLSLQELPVRKILKGNTISRCTGILCVLSGVLRVFIINEKGKEMTLYRLFDNDVCVLSNSCGLRNISFDVQVTAESESIVMTIPTQMYKRLEKNYSSVTQFTSSMMAARLSDVMWTLEQVAFSSMDKRVAAYLIEKRAIVQSDEIEITHDEIARELGTAREVISRMLKYFQNENWVTQKRGKVIIKNPSALLDISD